jgi:hypothetical protein
MKRLPMHKFIRLLFGDFNGAQVFLFPMTLYWWIDSDSFLLAITGLLTSRKYYFPLSVFLLLALLVAFLIIKQYNSLTDERGIIPQRDKTSFYNAAISINKTLLLTGIGVALLYVLSVFLNYYYNIKVPLKSILPVLFRLFGIILIMEFALIESWSIVFKQRGHSRKTVLKMVWLDMRRKPLAYTSHGLMLMVSVLIGSYLYDVMVVHLFYPASEFLGFTRKLVLLAPANIWAVCYDIFIFAVAFLLSNLLFSPIVRMICHFSNSLHPAISAKTKTYGDGN